MIVVDASAIVAMMLAEPGHEELAARMIAAGERVASPVTLVETTMVLSRSLSTPKARLDTYLKQGNISVCSIDSVQAGWAQHAFLTYGKGRHPARLNLGDCFSYAAAKALNAPLLYVGGDFAHTDIEAA